MKLKSVEVASPVEEVAPVTRLPEPSIEEIVEEEYSLDVRVQAKQVRDLILLRIRNIESSTDSMHAIQISLHDATLLAAKGPKVWNKEQFNNKCSLFNR